MEEFSDAVTAESFVHSEGWGKCAGYAGYIGSDVTIQGTGFYLLLVVF